MTDESLISMLNDYKENLENYYNKVTNQAENRANGTLICHTRKNGRSYYYLVSKPGGEKHYLRKGELQKASAIAQRDYNKKYLKAVRNKIKAANEMLDVVSDNDSAAIFGMLPEARRKIVDPAEVSTELYIRRWLDESYEKKPFADDAPVHLTARGERVRSKSEILIADTLDAKGIPYKYEHPLIVCGRQLYPDFTVMNPVTRKVYYWEHLGMMDDLSYSEDAIRRILLYNSSGINPGKNLILTFENYRNPLNRQYIERIILDYLSDKIG